MDPISRALQDFQTAFRRFRQNDEQLVLSVDTQPEHLEMLAKSLRVEEWQPDNQSPILIFPMPFLKPDDALIQMRLVVLEHYKELQKGMKEQGQILPPLVAEPHLDNPLLAFTSALKAFRHEIRAFLKEPMLCWMPTQVGKPGEWHAFLYKMLGLLPPEKVPMLIAGPPHKDLSKALDVLGAAVAFHPFQIDEDQSADYFTKLMGPPSAGHAPGTPSGSAAPDVVPPPDRDRPALTMPRFGRPQKKPDSAPCSHLRRLICCDNMSWLRPGRLEQESGKRLCAIRWQPAGFVVRPELFWNRP